MYMDILNEYFEVVSDDVYVTFNGSRGGKMKGGSKNILYGKRVNLSELYNKMIDDVIESMYNGKFLGDEFLDKSGHVHFMAQVNRYTCKKYGISFEWADKIVNKRVGGLDTDGLYCCMINRVGGVDKIDWMKLYDNSKSFITDNDDILMYIGKEILKGEIYRYFVNRFNLRVVGVTTKLMSDNTLSKRIILEWDGGRRLDRIGHMVRNKRDWWRFATYSRGKGGNKERNSINDYDMLLNGRSEDEVLPNRCPIDDSIILNYTGIDFSDKDLNINVCKNNDGIEEVWSAASIDRKDSNKPYTYDNVEIISHYYNTQVKNCASVHQISKLNMYQIDKMVKSIHRNEVEFSKLSDVELVKYISLYESVLCTYDVILDKTSKYMDEYKRRNPEVFEENVI